MPLTVKPVEPLQTPDHVLQVPPQIPTHPIAWPSVSGAGAVDDELVQHILDEVEQAGAEGLDKAELYDMDGIEAEDVDNALSAIGAQRPLAVFWAGYDFDEIRTGMDAASHHAGRTDKSTCAAAILHAKAMGGYVWHSAD